MANTSFMISVSTPYTVSEMQKYIKSTSSPRQQCLALAQMFERIEIGIDRGSFGVQTSGSPIARASQVLTLTYAGISNNDTVVVAGVTLTCVTGTPGAHQFKKQTDATVTAANLVALVNSDATISIYVKASSVLGVVTFTAQTPGLVGNFLTLVGSTGMVATGATFTGGTGGCETSPLNYTRG